MRSLILFLLLFVFLPARADDPAPFEIREGDRVVLLGDALLERENTYGYLETRMHEQFPDRKFIVRNLSWAGDTPRGWSRASFDPPEKGYEWLKEAIALVKPTVVFLGYGMAASLQEMTDRAQDITLNRDEARYGSEPMSAARFKKELGELMDAIQKASADYADSRRLPPAEPVSENLRKSAQSADKSSADKPSAVRFVLLSPIRHEDLRAVRPGLPDPAPHNALLEQYSKAIEELAKEKGARFLNFASISNIGWTPEPAHLTDNGIHLNKVGYRFGAFRNFAPDLGWGATAAEREYWDESKKADALARDKIVAQKLSAVTSFNAKSDALRAAVLKKNDLFFHRFRPENATYLFGFRKHEQGQNAVEIPKFDPLIEAADAEIDRLKRNKGASLAPTNPRLAAKAEQHAPDRSNLDSDLAKTTPHPAILPPQAPDVSQQAPDVSRQTLFVSQQTPLVSQQTPLVSHQTPLVSHQTPLVSQQTPEVTLCTPRFSSDSPDFILAQAAPAPKGPIDAPTPPPLPDFTVADGYQIELWAQNPLLEKPTQMNWDALGRLWVCSSSLYPQIEPGQAANDKILILEDTDRDGKADKSTVFADGLLIPTAVVPDLVAKDSTPNAKRQTPNAKGSDSDSDATQHPTRNTQLSPSACYVGQSTELLRFEDTDGDGKADTKRVVFSGFGTEDTHHLIHTLKWGPDGRLYWNQSIYIHSHLETPWGMVRLNSGGIFAFDPRTERVEVYAKGWCNPWGHAWDQWGQSFTTDGAGGQGVSWVIPGAMYFTYENARRIAPSISPGNYPKFCSLELIHSPMFPDDWQGNAVTNDFRAHRIVRFAIEDLSHPSHDSQPSHGTDGKDGKNALSGYSTKEMPDLVRTNDQSFRPIDIRLGPDGALYVADWSNPVINHGEVDFRDPRRDHHMGRIWRISKKDTPPVKWKPLLTMAAPAAGRDGSPNRPPQSANAGEASAKQSSKADGATPLSNEALLEKLLSKNAWEQEQARAVGGFRLAKTKRDTMEFGRTILGSKKLAGDDAVLSKAWLMCRAEFNIGGGGFERALPYLVTVARLLDSKDPRYRAQAVRLLPTALVPTLKAMEPIYKKHWAETAAAFEELKKKVAALEAANDQKGLEELKRRIELDDSGMGKPWLDPDELSKGIANSARDANPRVRIELMRALSRIPTAQSAALVLEAAMKSPGETGAINARGEEKGGQFDKPTFSDTKDPHYGYAAWLSINDLAKPWTDAIASGAWKADTAERQQQLAWGLRAIDPALAGATISRLMSEQKVPLDGSEPWLGLISSAGGPHELQTLFHTAFKPARFTPHPARGAICLALAEAARLRNVFPEGDRREAGAALTNYLKENPAPADGAAALRLLGAWKLEEAVIDTTAAMDAKTPGELRFAAIDALRGVGSLSSMNLLETLTRPDQDLAIRRAALVAITQVKLDAGVVKAADVLPAITDENAALETWRALLAVKGAPEAFAVKLPRDLPKPVATAGVRAAREAGKNGAKLLAALTPLAGISDAEAKMPKDFKALAAQTKQNGDPARGELIYRRAALTCTVCHAIGGAGGKVGPDMTSLGASAPLDYIIESTLNPTVKVKEGYNAVTLTLKDGTQAVGVQTRETPEEVFLRDATGREQRVPKAQIASTANLGSLMPAGLTDQLQDRERLDLFAFLGELGKPGPYDASKGNVARYWQLANEPLQEDGTLHVNTAALPAYTLVDGRFLKEQLKELLPGVTARGETVVYAAAKFQSTGGKTRLKLTGATKVSLDGKPLALEADLAPDLASGVHTIVVKLDVSALPEVLRAESPDARFLGN